MAYRPERRWPRWARGPGAGGAWKQAPEDFFVEEIPLAPPEGEGPHGWLWVEKVGHTTDEVAELLARRAGVRRSDVGYAGLKDRYARTRQAFTIHGGSDPAGWGPMPEGVKILRSGRCAKKLRVGALAGNRFRVRITGARLPVLEARLDDLAASGVPNYYGPQRVGGEAPDQGRALLCMPWAEAEGRARALGHTKLRFALSAWQALAFNEVLAERGGARLRGDLEEADPQGERVPTGPLFGHAMAWPAGEALELEEAILLREGLPPRALSRWPELTQGARRALWFGLDAGLERAEAGIWLHLRLPAGSYATTVLEELL